PKIISGGGSGTYLICADYGLHTEIQAGGAVFTDSAYHLWGTLTTPSIFVRSVVTSRPDPLRIITDSGWKSLPCWVVDPIPKNVDGCNSVRMSSEHGILNLDQENTDIRPGDFIDFQVGYGDSTVFLHQKLHGVRNGELESTWDIAGRGKVF
ncbi:MAG: DSD1 family PLP-dependent enzyme, partial [SAR324 cluster bacterium]|nr:DSD1 family PLP-dependent enzyme [SAR324 cluster bacterium]